ncbi:hypothetical protein F0L17_11470 [Streptomyces sp. TRM43335]|uniref:DUF6234 domain-containing protein n=1 Tax=Streptomyces taklimakanensis TaxID=2569853 RepID=A0A6G2BCV3_9ACTN|nr:DUF6234 family protein [Streptomyces taklimakanensis]MTE19732.1 hypothetical protein [Streptomyces taklimakanensis]
MSPVLSTSGTSGASGTSGGARGDAVSGVLVGFVLLLAEVAGALVVMVGLGLRNWTDAGGHREGGGPGEPPPMDWVPVLWCGGFALAVLALAVVFLRAGRPGVGAVQLLVFAAALTATVLTWHGEHERAHPDPPPASPYRDDPGGRPCLSGGDSRECLDGGG